MAKHPGGIHGAYPRAELERVLGPHRVDAEVREGALLVYSRGVVVDVRVAANLLTRCAAALLLAGAEAVLSGFTALALYGCSAAPAGPIDVLVPYHRNLRPRAGLAVHHRAAVPDGGEEISGLRVVPVDYALAEVLCRGRSSDALACADQVLAMTPLAERAELKASIEAQIVARPDPRGRRRGLTVLDLANGVRESPAESWCVLCMFDAGLPVPESQYPVHNLDGVAIYFLDFAWPELRIAVEYDGYAAHAGRAQFDAARAEDLRRRGWIVIRATSADLRDPSRLIAEICAAFAARGAAAA